MPRCNSCNKFAGVDSDNDPDVSIDLEGPDITGTVSIENNCADCGDTLQTAEFEVAMEIPAAFLMHAYQDTADSSKRSKPVRHELSVDADITRTDRYGKGRRAAHFYGAEGTITVQCACGQNVNINWSDEVQSSGMDEA